MPVAVILDNEPKFLLRLRKHSCYINLVTMIEPVTFFVTDNLCQWSLIRNHQRLFGKRLLLGFNRDLNLAFVSVYQLYVSYNFAGPLMSYWLCLELFAFEIEQAEGVFLPRLSLYMEPKTKQQFINSILSISKMSKTKLLFLHHTILLYYLLWKPFSNSFCTRSRLSSFSLRSSSLMMF